MACLLFPYFVIFPFFSTSFFFFLRFLSADELGCCKMAQGTFPLQPGTRPIDRAPYRTSPRVQKQSDDQVDKLFKQGIIEERTNAWGFLFLLSARLMGHHGPVLTTVTLFTVI